MIDSKHRSGSQAVFGIEIDQPLLPLPFDAFEEMDENGALVLVHADLALKKLPVSQRLELHVDRDEGERKLFWLVRASGMNIPFLQVSFLQTVQTDG